MTMHYKDVLKFWFDTLSPKDWWRKSENLDRQIKQQFADTHTQITQGETESWRDTDPGRLAEIIVLDQFSRNMFRGLADSFAYDELALKLSKAAVDAGVLTRLDQEHCSFVLMPFMHSESLSEHEQAIPLFKAYCSENTLDFEQRHAAIIRRFGRYPHRNEILGRASTPEETKFLSQVGSSF